MYLQTNIKLIISHGIHCHQFTWDAYGKCHVEDVAELISDHEKADSDTDNHSFVVIRHWCCHHLFQVFWSHTKSIFPNWKAKLNLQHIM